MGELATHSETCPTCGIYLNSEAEHDLHQAESHPEPPAEPEPEATPCLKCKWRPRGPVSLYYCDPCQDAIHRRQEEHRNNALYRLHEDCPRLYAATWKNTDEDDHNREAIDLVSNWAYDDAEYRTLYLWGPVGTGKTRLAYLAAKQFIAGGTDETARLIGVRNLLAETRASMSNDDENPVNALLAEDISILILDDLGAERPTDWSLEVVATVVEARYHERYAQTIVTSNYSPSQLVKRYGTKDVTTGQRIVSRLIEDSLVVKLEGPDRRVRKAE